MKLSLISIGVFLSAVAQASGQQSKPAQGFYARSATPIWEKIAGSSVPMKISSPDGRSLVIARYSEDRSGDSRVRLRVRGAVGMLTVDLGAGVGSELSWAPDSKGFFVTTSDGGANGPYRVILVENFSGKLTKNDVSGLVIKTFGHPVFCPEPEPPNVGGIGWLRKGSSVLVAAEIVNHSVCDSPGTFAVYEINVETVQMVRRYGQLEAKHRFASLLGQELKAAPDKCILSPASCYVATNHPK
jgi:hypothetical protein